MTIRWKPHSEANGNLVVLTNEPFALIDGSGQVVRGQNDGPSNGYRYTVRYPRPGSAYRGARIKTRGGLYAVPNPSRDYGGGKGPELPKASQTASQGASNLSPQAQALRDRLSGMSRGEQRAYLERELQRNPNLPGLIGLGAVGFLPGSTNADELVGNVVSDGVGQAVQGFGRRVVGNMLPNAEWPSMAGRVASTVAPNAAVNATFGSGLSSAIPGAVGSVKGPAAFASGSSGLGGISAGLNAAMPYLIPAIAGIQVLNQLTGPTSLQKWRGLSKQAYAAGAGGGVRPESLMNHFSVDSAPQVAYDLGKAGKPLAFEGGLNAKDFQRQQQAQAKSNVMSEGFTPKAVYQSNAGPTFTQKQKAAAKILQPATNSQVNMSNPWVLTDADRGR